jgi:hypothetical protein
LFHATKIIDNNGSQLISPPKNLSERYKREARKILEKENVKIHCFQLIKSQYRMRSAEKIKEEK